MGGYPALLTLTSGASPSTDCSGPSLTCYDWMSLIIKFSTIETELWRLP
jgi:hypothetical protein